MEILLQNIFEKPIASLSTFQDLKQHPKLLEVSLHDLFAENENTTETQLFGELAINFEKLASQLEKENYSTVLPILNRFATTCTVENFLSLTETLFNSFEDSSSFVRLFKVVNREVITVGLDEILSRIKSVSITDEPNLLKTQEDSSTDDWRVEIRFSSSKISVVHFRREEGLVPSTSSPWYLTWKYLLCFTLDMSTLLSCEVQLVSTSFSPETPPEAQADLERVLEEALGQTTQQTNVDLPPSPPPYLYVEQLSSNPAHASPPSPPSPATSASYPPPPPPPTSSLTPPVIHRMEIDRSASSPSSSSTASSNMRDILYSKPATNQTTNNNKTNQNQRNNNTSRNNRDRDCDCGDCSGGDCDCDCGDCNFDF